MAYSDTVNARNRMPTLVSVAALHVALGYALVSGLGASVIETVSTKLEAKFIPQPDVVVPIDPPPPVEQQAASDPVVTAPIPKVPLSPSNSEFRIETPMFDDIPTAPLPGLGKVIAPMPPAPTPPAFAPKQAAPAGNPGSWVTTDDYPGRELRMGHQGVTGFAVTIGTNGRVENCTITSSSGWPALDSATCRLVSKRAKFKPATGGDGAATVGQYASAVRWEIPD